MRKHLMTGEVPLTGLMIPTSEIETKGIRVESICFRLLIFIYQSPTSHKIGLFGLI